MRHVSDHIGREVDGYLIEELLGRGGMGIVYKAVDVALGRPVALKIIDPSLATDQTFLRRFRAEAKALARIHDPNIVGIYALRETDLGLVIVMEYVDGGTVADLIREEGALSWERCLPIVKQMLRALHYAHGAGVIHRDIKPRNIMLTQAGQVKVTDFGLAKVRRRDRHATVAAGMQTTVTSAMAGTLYYMSPEQVQGLRQVDHRGDLYALGMTMYEMLAGQVPFDHDDSEFVIMKRIVEGKLPPPTRFIPALPKPLVKIISRSLEKDPDKRYQSAEEMLRAVEAFEERQRAGRGRARPRIPRIPVAALAAAVVVLVLAGGGYLLWPRLFPATLTLEHETAEDTGVDIPVRGRDDGAAPLTAVQISSPRYGAAEIVDDGRTVRYTPEADFSGEDRFGYRAVDAEGRALETDVRVRVRSVNDPPVVVQPVGARTQGLDGGRVQVDLASVFADVDGDRLAYTARADNESVARAGVLGSVLTLDLVATGQALVTVSAEDGSGERVEDEFALTVTEATVRTPVVATPIRDLQLEAGGNAFSADLGRVFRDPDGAALAFEVRSSDPRVAEPAVSGTMLSVEPRAPGRATITVTARNDAGGLERDVFIATVGAEAVANRAPVAVRDAASTRQGAPVTIPVLRNDSDADGDVLTVVRVSDPANGAVLIVDDGQAVRYTPDPGFSGADRFTYEVVAGSDRTPPTEVRVTVEAAPRAGTLELIVRPWGRLTVDGAEQAARVSARTSFALPSGRRTITIENPELGVWQETVEIPAGGAYELDLDFRNPVDVRVTMPEDADGQPVRGGIIHVNGASTGRTAPGRIQVPVGLNTIEVRADGYAQIEVQDAQSGRRLGTRINFDPRAPERRLKILLRKEGP